MVKIIPIIDFHVSQLDVINAVQRLDALMRLFDKAGRQRFINHVTEEPKMYHRAVVFLCL